ncbi:MAG: isoprenylcysteine carboxylmethyltransferase family protein, partial [Pseudomonadota bacterium]
LPSHTYALYNTLMSTDEKPDHPNVETLPPVTLLLYVVGGLVLNWILPIFEYGWGWGLIGLVMLAFAFALIYYSKKQFEAAGTNVPPNQPATVIVTTGPFKYSRNPIYLSFLVGFVGLSFIAGAPLMTLLAIPLYRTLKYDVIAKEEYYLESKFGKAYTDYKDNVRRWI